MITRQIIFLSLAIIAIGVILWKAGRRILSRGKMSKATIVNNIYSPNELTDFQNYIGVDNGESGTYYPVIQFITDKDERITKQLTIGFNPPQSIGKKLPVIYNPISPNDISLYPRIQLEYIPKLLISIGVIGLIIVMLDFLEIISVMPAN